MNPSANPRKAKTAAGGEGAVKNEAAGSDENAEDAAAAGANPKTPASRKRKRAAPRKKRAQTPIKSDTDSEADADIDDSPAKKQPRPRRAVKKEPRAVKKEESSPAIKQEDTEGEDAAAASADVNIKTEGSSQLCRLR